MAVARRVLVAVLVGLVLATAGLARARSGRDHRTLWLYNVHTGEEIRLRPFDRHGRPRGVRAARLRRIFRRLHSDRQHPVSPRLLRLLVQVQRHFGGRRIGLVSGYRAPEGPRRLSSYHQVGRAADISVSGVPHRKVFDYCTTLPRTGCGLYPVAGSHIHVDARADSAVWVDLSRSGEAAIYVRDVDAWLTSHPDAGGR